MLIHTLIESRTGRHTQTYTHRNIQRTHIHTHAHPEHRNRHILTHTHRTKKQVHTQNKQTHIRTDHQHCVMYTSMRFMAYTQNEEESSFLTIMTRKIKKIKGNSIPFPVRDFKPNKIHILFYIFGYSPAMIS